MIHVRVAAIALDTSGQHVVLLKPDDPTPELNLMLPIWIGRQEASSILSAIEGAETPRPLVHELIVSMLDSLSAAVTKVTVTELSEGTFYAEITITTTTESFTIDARPSDAIAIASRAGVGIYVAEEVLSEAGVEDHITEEREPMTEDQIDEFTQFLEDVNPEDFKE